MPKATPDPVRISGVSRVRALVKFILLSVGGTLLLLPAFYVWPTLHFVPSAVSNRLTTYAFECVDPAEVDPDLLGLEPEEEMETHLPRMRHPNVQGDINRLFEKFA